MIFNKSILSAPVLCVLLGIGLASSAKVEMTLFSDADYSGQSITVNQTHLEFQCVTNVVGLGEGIKSVCYIGAWAAVTATSTSYFTPSTTRICQKSFSGHVNFEGIYQFGPPDTSTPAITFSRPNQITVVEKIAEGNLNITTSVIVVSRVFTNGGSNWTLYELNNFEGNSTCVISGTEIKQYSATSFGLPSIGSVVKGCNHRTKLEDN